MNINVNVCFTILGIFIFYLLSLSLKKHKSLTSVASSTLSTGDIVIKMMWPLSVGRKDFFFSLTLFFCCFKLLFSWILLNISEI